MLNVLVEGALLAFGFAMMPLLESAIPDVPASDRTAIRIGAGKPFHDESVADDRALCLRTGQKFPEVSS